MSDAAAAERGGIPVEADAGRDPDALRALEGQGGFAEKRALCRSLVRAGLSCVHVAALRGNMDRPAYAAAHPERKGKLARVVLQGCRKAVWFFPDARAMEAYRHWCRGPEQEMWEGPDRV